MPKLFYKQGSATGLVKIFQKMELQTLTSFLVSGLLVFSIRLCTLLQWPTVLYLLAPAGPQVCQHNLYTIRWQKMMEEKEEKENCPVLTTALLTRGPWEKGENRKLSRT